MLNSFMIMVGSFSFSCSRFRVGFVFIVYEFRRINWVLDILFVVFFIIGIKNLINMKVKIKELRKLKIILFYNIKILLEFMFEKCKKKYCF